MLGLWVFGGGGSYSGGYLLWVFVSFMGKDRVGLRWVSGGDCIRFAVEIAVGVANQWWI